MIDWVISRNKEQITFACCVGLALLILLVGIVGRGSDVPEVRAAAALLEYAHLPSLQLRPLLPEFGKYWEGRNVFQTEGASLLPVPAIAVALPRDELPPFPLLRPRPTTEEYNRRSGSKYPGLLPKPLVAESDLLPPAELAALQGLPEPPPKEFKDQSRDSERECCVILWNVQRAPTEGYCFGGCARAEESADLIEFSGKDRKSKMSWKRSDIREIQHCWMNLDQYRYRAGKVREAEERIPLARWCLQKGMLAAAKDQLDKVLESKRDSVEAIRLLGDLLEDSADFDGALAHYQSYAESVSSLRDELRWRNGEVLRKLGLPESALEAFVKSSSSPRFFKGRVSQARMSLELDDPARAIEVAGDLLSSKFSSDSGFTAELRLTALAIRGQAHLRMGNLGAAIQNLSAAGRSAEVLTALGVCHALDARWKEAAAAFAAAIREDQYRIPAWVNLATLYGLAGKLPDAALLYQAAATRDPSDSDAVAGSALCSFFQGNREGAQKLVDTALSIDPESVYAAYLKGEWEPEAAMSQFRSALRRDSFFLPAQAAIATACLRDGGKKMLDGDGVSAKESLTRAEILYRRLIASNPQSAHLHLSLGCAYALLGRPDAARPRLDQAAALVRDAGLRPDPIVEYLFGYLQYRFGGEDARSRLTSALPYFKAASEAKGYDDPMSVRVIQEAGEMVKRIDEWRLTSLTVSEDFNRDDSDAVSWQGIRWEEQDRKPRGAIAVVGRRCVFSGDATQDWIPSKLERDNLPVEEFHRLEVTFLPQVQETATFEFGVSLYAPAQGEGVPRYGIQVGFDRRRRIRVGLLDDQRFDQDRHEMSENWQNKNQNFVAPAEIRLRLERKTKDNLSSLEIQIYNPSKREYEKVDEVPLSLQAGGKGGLKASFWARGWAKEKYALAMDDVRIYEKRRRP